MKRFCFKFRIMLLTFAVGLASVWMIDGSTNGLIEAPVNLPEVKSDNVIVVFPRYTKEMPQQGAGDGGGCCGWESQIITKAKSSRHFKDKHAH